MPSDNEVQFRLDLGEPPQHLLKWAKDNLGEDPDICCQLLSELRDKIYERGECEPYRTDDNFLLRFLRGRHFNVEKAYRLYVNYHDFKENNPQFFDGVDFNHLKKMGDHDVISVPPYREQTGRRILLYKIGKWNPEYFTVDEMFQVTLAVLELAIMEQRAQILGGIALFDFDGLSLNQAWYMTPSVAHKVIQIMVTSFPMKIYALHIVNQSYVFDVIYNIFKPFLNEKMKQRIFIHGNNFESLHQHIDPKYLPERYGGVHPDYSYKNWIDYIKKNKEILDEMLALGYQDNYDEDNNDNTLEVEKEITIKDEVEFKEN